MIVTTDLRSVLAMLSVALGSLAVHPQVQTEAPPPVPGAKPVALERIKVHGAALEGNLEGNAADRDVLAVLPPSYAKEKSRRFEHLRDLPRHPHEQGCRLPSEPRAAVLQSDLVCREGLSIERFDRT
jgi:hypothetical protein